MHTHREHFWLNEGCTVFVERKIMEKMEGPAARACQSIVGFEHLKDDIEHMGQDNPLTNLVPDLTGIDPDDAFSSVPYEKGYTFLTYLERTLGEAIFSKFFQSYLKHFQSTPITTAEFKTYLEKFCSDNGVPLVVDWYAWTCTAGLPPVAMEYDQTNHRTARECADQWVALNEKGGVSPVGAAEKWAGWSAVHMKVPVLDFLLEHVKTKGLLSEKVLEEMDKAYHLTDTKNSEIRFRWQRICLQCKYTAIFDHVVDFITTQGRMKFVRPLYRELLRVNPELARATFNQHKNTYHPIAAKMIGQDLDC
jgi:leukotriene-A4 hydrolase